MAVSVAPTAGQVRRRPAVPNGLYRAFLGVAGFIFVAILAGFVVDLVVQARPAIAHFGLGFIWGTQWNPVTAHYGALSFIVGTLETTLIAMVLAIPIGIGAALSLAYLLPGAARHVVGTAVELLAAVPSVVYGLWALLILAPLTRTVIEPVIGAAFFAQWPGERPRNRHRHSPRRADPVRHGPAYDDGNLKGRAGGGAEGTDRRGVCA